MLYPLFLILQACFAVWNQVAWWAGVALFSLVLLVLMFIEERAHKKRLLLATITFACGTYAFFPARHASLPLPSRDATLELRLKTSASKLLSDPQRVSLLKALREPPSNGNYGEDLLAGVILPEYISLSVLNLNMEPVAWHGRYFSSFEQKEMLTAPSIRFQDGRIFFTVMEPFPRQHGTSGYLVTDTLLVALRQEEMKHSWVGTLYPEYQNYHVTVVEAMTGQFMANLVNLLDLNTTLPYDLAFFPIPHRQQGKDVLSVLWFLLLFACVLNMQRGQKVSSRWPYYLVILGLLLIPTPSGREDLTTMASYIFGYYAPLGWIRNPLTLALSATTLFFLLYDLGAHEWRKNKFYECTLFLGAGAVAAFWPPFVQQNTPISLIHPLEGFSSPGAFLILFIFLLTFGFIALLLETPKSECPLPLKLVCAATLFIGLYYWELDGWVIVPPLLLIWLLKDVILPRFFREILYTGLVVLLFYPSMVRTEHKQEVEHLKNDILDEITLLTERNHFRMGRIIQNLERLTEDLEKGLVHEQLMLMFANRCGLFHDRIDFAVRLTRSGGQILSQVQQHISLDRIPYVLVPEGQIETVQEGGNQDGPIWMIYRKTIHANFGPFEFVAVLGNDYQNISLVRRLRQVDHQDVKAYTSTLTGYNAFSMDVFDLEGNPIYSQETPKHLDRTMMEQLGDQPFFWESSGRNTIFYLRDNFYQYRITHKATPNKMILARFLTLSLTLLIAMRLIFKGLRWPRSFYYQWNRSFAMKLATLMFMGSLLPTGTLGYFLIKSITKNQREEESSYARLKILAARNLAMELLKEGRDRVFPFEPEENQNQTNARIRIDDLPIHEMARVLGEDLSLYRAGNLVKTNQPEMFHLGLLDRRLTFTLTTELLRDKKTYTLIRRPTPGGQELLVAFSPFSLGRGKHAVLGMTMIPTNLQQRIRWQERIEFSFSILLGLLFLMAELTRTVSRNFLRPVSAITRNAFRMAKGLNNRPIPIKRQDELDRMVDAFNTMQDKVKRSQDQLQEQLGIQDQIMTSMSSGLFGCDPDRNIVFGNPKAWELLDLEISQRPRLMKDLILLRPGLAPLTDLMLSLEHGEFNFHDDSGHLQREILVRLRIVEGWSRIKYIVVLEDITHAMEANRFKAWAEMARRVAHEIKNPLTPIQLEIDHVLKLHQDKHPMFDEALEEAADEIKNQITHLRNTATEFSDYARPVQVNKSRVNLADFISNILSPYEKTLAHMHIEKILNPEIEMEIDPQLLRRAVHNLVVNAFQAMDEEGSLCVRLFNRLGEIHIWIEDNGPGVAPEDRKRIFEAYFSTKVQGTGLGMVIAKKYVDLHGGRLYIDPNYQGGTRMIISLPEV